MIRPRSKFGSVKTTLDNITFDSAGEANRYALLKLRQRAGEISGLELQPVFPIVIDGKPLRIRTKRGQGKPITAVMDFAYFENGKRVCEDFKGMDTPMSRIKRALVEHIYGITILVTGRAA